MASSLDLYHLVRELQPLVGARIEKISALSHQEFYVQVHKTGIGKQILCVRPGQEILRIDAKEPTEQPSPFVMFLRKHLALATITAISQHDFERICIFSLRTKEGTYFFIVELFSKGNLIFCDSSYRILQCLSQQTWKDRTIKIGALYQFPASRVIPFTLSLADFSHLIHMSDKENIVKTLALDFSLGGSAAEYLCAQAHINKNAKELSVEETQRLYAALLHLAEEKPALAQVTHTVSQQQERIWQEQIAKWETRVAKQQEHLTHLEQVALVDQRKGDLLYAHYTDVEAALRQRLPVLTLAGITFTLDAHKSVAWHATVCYEAAKKARRKLDMARASLAESLQKLAHLREHPPQPKAPKIPTRAREWYEKFYWFYSSGGFLVIGGRDATTNDIVMKKHRTAADLVFHTEEPGSPFFVVQTQGRDVDAATIQEAAQAAASYSQQWKSGKSTADVFYACGDCFFKLPQDPAGTFHVRGERTTLTAVLSVAISFAGRVLSGPPAALAQTGGTYLVLVPGTIKKGDIAKKIAHLLGAPEEEVLRGIPAGESSITTPR